MDVHRHGGPKSRSTKAEKWFCFMSATFQISSLNFKQLYLLGLLAKLAELGLVGKLLKSAFRSLLVQVNWISRLRDIRQNVQAYTGWNRFCCF